MPSIFDNSGSFGCTTKPNFSGSGGGGARFPVPRTQFNKKL